MSFGSAPFFAYEGLRIIVPGLVAYALLFAAEPAYADIATLSDLTGGGITVTLGVGFLLYFVDLTSYTPLYKTNVAVEHLARIDLRLPQLRVLNRYFVALDALFPQALRDRSMYFTEIYRIGFETILLGVTAQALFWTRWHLVRPDHVMPPVAAIGLVLVLALVLVGASWRRLADSRNRRLTMEGFKSWRGDIRNEVGSVGAGVLALSVMGAGIAHATDSHSIYFLAVALAWALWVVKAVFGFYVPKNKDYEQISSYVSALLFLVLAVVAIGGHVELDAEWTDWNPDGTTLQWLLLTVATAIVIGARGHEKKIQGSRYEQREWLILNSAEVSKELFPPAVD